MPQLFPGSLPRLLSAACIVLVLATAALAAVPFCCDDDCGEDEGTCVAQCGPCIVVAEPPAADPPLTLSSRLEPPPVTVRSAFDAAIAEILHVPRRMA